MSVTRLATLGSAALLAGAALVAAQEFRVPMPLAQLVGKADVIARGRIRTVGPETFSMDVEEIVMARAEVAEGPLTVKCSTRAVTDPRWAPYHEAQEILVFLERDAEDPDWSFAGMPNDSEWPVDGEYVYLYDRYIEGLPLERLDLHGHQFYAQVMPLETVVSALRDYGSVFRWERAAADGRWRPRKISTRGLPGSFADQSALHRLLAMETAAATRPPVD